LVAELQHFLAEGWPEIQDGTRETHPTFFEALTVMALRYFAEQECELVIWETGLGGRLDATNIVTPLASVITNIGFDHQQWLGHTPAQSGARKGRNHQTRRSRHHGGDARPRAGSHRTNRRTPRRAPHRSGAGGVACATS